MTGIVPYTDYFVIASGTSDRMLKALMGAVRDKVREDHEKRPRVEGEALEGWMLADFGDVILHLFSPEQRHFYNLESLWPDGKVLLHVQ